MQTTCSTLPNTHFLRKAILFLLVLASTFIWIQTDKAAQSRRDFAADQNEDDGLEFSTEGTLDRTIVITIFPVDRPEEDSLVGFVLHDSEGKKMREGLRSQGFNSIRCGVVEEKIR